MSWYGPSILRSQRSLAGDLLGNAGLLWLAGGGGFAAGAGDHDAKVGLGAARPQPCPFTYALTLEYPAVGTGLMYLLLFIRFAADWLF